MRKEKVRIRFAGKLAKRTRDSYFSTSWSS